VFCQCTSCCCRGGLPLNAQYVLGGCELQLERPGSGWSCQSTDNFRPKCSMGQGEVQSSLETPQVSSSAGEATASQRGLRRSYCTKRRPTRPRRSPR
jgi:hypothetical protein